METFKTSKSLIERLLDGEEITCQICHKGIYRPFNPRFKINHSFVCDQCGSHIHWDPVVEIDTKRQ